MHLDHDHEDIHEHEHEHDHVHGHDHEHTHTACGELGSTFSRITLSLTCSGSTNRSLCFS